MAAFGSASSPRRRAVVVGGSMSALFSAALLRRAGWDVDVFERSRVELAGRGAGISVHPELIAALELAGAEVEALGVRVEKRIVLDRGGEIIHERTLPQIMTSWDRLQRMLRALVPHERHHLDCGFEGFEQDADGVTAHFTGGRAERADLLVAGDGFRSTIRAQLLPDAQPTYAGYVVWRGAPDEAALRPETHEAIFRTFTFFLPPGQQVIGYPIAGFDDDLRPGRRRYNFIWYRIVDEDRLRDLCTDAAGTHHPFSIAPPLIRDDIIAEMRATASHTMPAPFLDVLACVKRPFFTPIYDFVAPRMAFGRVALIGDAASISRPHMGFGVSKAAEDARVLAEALSGGGEVAAGLARFNAIRQPVGEKIFAHGRKLGAYFGVNIETAAQREMGRILQEPSGMTRLLAVPDFLMEPAEA